jgi:hypothetical protein
MSSIIPELVLILVFFFSRLAFLMNLPLFLDESIYIRWLRAMTADFQQWLLPLKENGWEPLSPWLASLINLLVHDGLLSLRLSAVFFGALSAWFICKLLRLLVKSPAARFWAVLLIISSPVVLIHDRLGLRGDSAVSFAAMMFLYGLYSRLIKKNKRAGYLIGLALAIGLLAKTTAWFLLGLVFLSYLAFRPKLTKSDLALLIFPGLIFCFYLLSGSLAAVLNKNSTFVLSLAQAGSLVKANSLQIGRWSYQYLTWPVLLLVLFGAVLTYFEQRQVWLLLTINILPVLIFNLFFSKILFPRYLLFIAVYGLIFAALGLAWLWSRVSQLMRILLIIFLLAQVSWLDFRIITNMAQAQLPEIERWQYVTGWPSGYGLNNLADFLKADPPDILITESNDLVRSGLRYFWPELPIKIYSLDDTNWLSGSSYRDVYQFFLQGKTVYLVLNILDQPTVQFEAELINSFPRPGNKSSLRVYSLKRIL